MEWAFTLLHPPSTHLPFSPSKPAQESQNSTTHSLPFTSNLPRQSHLFISIFISLQAKWSVWIYSYLSLCLLSISYCLQFSLLVSLRCIFSACNAVHPSLSLSDFILQSFSLLVSHSPSFPLCPFHLFPASGNPIHLTLRIISSNQGPLSRQGRAPRDRLSNSLMGLDLPPVHHLRKPTLGQSPLHIVSYGCHLGVLFFVCTHTNTRVPISSL